MQIDFYTWHSIVIDVELVVEWYTVVVVYKTLIHIHQSFAVESLRLWIEYTIGLYILVVVIF